jgi:hypothetical protein
MASSRERRIPDSVGLMASGVSGPWLVNIDEAWSGERWFAHIEGPSVYVYFEISSVDIVETALELLESGSQTAQVAPRQSDEELQLWTSRSHWVSLVRDNEFSDR